MTGTDNLEGSHESASVPQSVYERIAGFLSAFAIGAIVVITAAQVFSRYFLNDSIYWAEEASRGLLVWACFLFAGVAFKRGEMAAVEFVTASLPLLARDLVLGGGRLVTAIFLFVLAYYGWLYAAQNWVQPVPGLQMLAQSLLGDEASFSIFWVYVALPIGCVILAITMLWSAVVLLTQPRRHPNKC